MAKEKEITKRLTRLIKTGDKLVQDIQRDIGQLVATATGLKEIFIDFKNDLKGQDDSKQE